MLLLQAQVLGTACAAWICALLLLQSLGERGHHYFSTLNQSIFSPLYNDAAFSDVVIKAGRTGLKAHKAILAAHSPTFKAMFEVTPCSALPASVCLLVLLYSTALGT